MRSNLLSFENIRDSIPVPGPRLPSRTRTATSAVRACLTGGSASTLRSPRRRSRGRAQSRKGKAHRGQRPCCAAPANRGEETHSKRTTTASRTPVTAALRHAGTLRLALLPTGVRLLLRRRASHANDGTLWGHNALGELHAAQRQIRTLSALSVECTPVTL